MDNKNLGREVFDRTYDPSFIQGWGVRPYNWGLGLSVQQELLPRVSVNVGYFRNWWGNWYTVDNRSTASRRLHTVQHQGAGRFAAAERRRIHGGRVIQPRPREIGAVDEWATSSTNYAKQTESWQGVDVGINARLRNGLTIQGGTSTGRALADACGLKAAVPEQGQGTRGDTTSIAGGDVVQSVLPSRRAVSERRFAASRPIRFRALTCRSAAPGPAIRATTCRPITW